MTHNAINKIDVLALALNILQSKIAIGAVVKVADMVSKAGREPALIEAIKKLIDAGWCEYEFTDDYTAVRRLDLPDYARTYFKKMQYDYEQKKQNKSKAVGK